MLKSETYQAVSSATNCNVCKISSKIVFFRFKMQSAKHKQKNPLHLLTAVSQGIMHIFGKICISAGNLFQMTKMHNIYLHNPDVLNPCTCINKNTPANIR